MAVDRTLRHWNHRLVAGHCPGDDGVAAEPIDGLHPAGPDGLPRLDSEVVGQYRCRAALAGGGLRLSRADAEHAGGRRRAAARPVLRENASAAADRCRHQGHSGVP